MNEKDIYYKGYRLFLEKSTNAMFEKLYKYKARVLGREAARYRGYGDTTEEAIVELKKEIDKVRK